MLSDIAVVSVFLTEAIMNAQEILNMNDVSQTFQFEISIGV